MLRRLALFLVLTSMCRPSLSFALVDSDPAILEIHVNGFNQGQQFVRITRDNDVLLTPKTLSTLRLDPEHWATGKKEQISLRSLGEEAMFTLDRNNAQLTLTVPPDWFKEQTIGPEPKATPRTNITAIRPQPTSAFLNYSLRANGIEGEGWTSADAPLEIGFNHKQWLALSTSNTRYDRETDSGETVRLMSTVLWDDIDNLRSLALGDFTQPYSLLLGGGNFGGISLRKNYRMDRSFNYTADLGLETRITSPTHAELYVNGRVVEEWELLPGIVNFSNISSYAGGDAELVLTDAFGRVRRLSVPSYTSQHVLKKGLHDYAYSLGWQRENLGIESADYGDPVFMGYHQYGFSNTWTGGIAFAATEDAQAVGPSIAALIGGFSQGEAGFLISKNELDQTGYTATARYSYRYNNLSGYMGVTGYSREYTRVPPVATSETIGTSQPQYQPRLLGSVNINYASGNWGIFGLGYLENHTWDQTTDPRRTLTLSYRKNIASGLNLTLGFRRDIDNEDDDEGYLTLQYYPGRTSAFYDQASLTSRYREAGDEENQFSVQKNPPRGIGWGYRTALIEREGDVSANGRGQYNGERGIYTVVANRSEDSQLSGSVSVAGGIVLLNGSVYQGRPVMDSFAVVNVDGLDAVTVENGSVSMGTAGEEKSLLVPDLSSYNTNRLTIATPNLPINQTAAQSEHVVEVKQRSGSLVNFKFSRFSAVDGQVYLATGSNDNMPLEYLPVEYVVNGEKRESFLGENGYFYLENLPTGTNLLRIRRAEGDCLSEIEIPESEKVVFSLGQLACTPEY